MSILEKLDVDVAWVPESQTVDGALTASFSLVVTNTGNVVSTIQLTGSASPHATILFETGVLQIPARNRATLLVGVRVPRGGDYHLTATAQSGPVQGSASADLEVIYITEPPKLYLPLIIKMR